MEDIDVDTNLTITHIERPLTDDNTLQSEFLPILSYLPGGKGKRSSRRLWPTYSPSAAGGAAVSWLQLNHSRFVSCHRVTGEVESNVVSLVSNRKLITTQLLPLRVLLTFPKGTDKSITPSQYTLFCGMEKHQ